MVIPNQKEILSCSSQECENVELLTAIVPFYLHLEVVTDLRQAHSAEYVPGKRSLWRLTARMGAAARFGRFFDEDKRRQSDSPLVGPSAAIRTWWNVSQMGGP